MNRYKGRTRAQRQAWTRQARLIMAVQYEHAKLVCNLNQLVAEWVGIFEKQRQEVNDALTKSYKINEEDADHMWDEIKRMEERINEDIQDVLKEALKLTERLEHS